MPRRAFSPSLVRILSSPCRRMKTNLTIEIIVILIIRADTGPVGNPHTINAAFPRSASLSPFAAIRMAGLEILKKIDFTAVFTRTSIHKRIMLPPLPYNLAKVACSSHTKSSPCIYGIVSPGSLRNQLRVNAYPQFSQDSTQPFHP